MKEKQKSYVLSSGIKIKNLVKFFILGMLTYGNALFNQFVWDDKFQPIGSSKMGIIANIWHLFFVKLQDFHYRPLFFTYLYLINYFYGPNPFAFHLLQIIAHISNACLVYLLYRYFLPNRISLFLGLFFLIHPINVEAVSFISAGADVLFFLPGIIALLVTIQTSENIVWLIITSTLLVCSLLIKENGILFILVTIVAALFFNRPLKIKKLIPPFVAMVIYALLRFLIVKVFITHSIFAPIMKLPLNLRILSIPKIIWYYISTVIFPQKLIISQQWTVQATTLSDFWLPLGLDLLMGLGISLGLFIIYRINRAHIKPYLFFLICFVAGLLVHIQLLPLDMTVADRWFYFSLMGLLGLIGVLLYQFPPSILHKKQIITLSIFLLTMYAFRSIIRNFDWRDGYTLYTHDSSYGSQSYDLENNLGVELLNQGRYDLAEFHLLRSIELEPHSEKNRTNLGIVYLYTGKYPEAQAQLNSALKIDPHYQIAYEYLSAMYIKDEDFIGAQTLIQQALTKFPESAQLWKNLALIQLKLRSITQAHLSAQKAYDLDPSEENKQLLTQTTELP